MVRDLLERITAPVRRAVMRPIQSLHQAAYFLAVLTLASQVLALLRDRIFAASFGAGQTLDLYYAAFRVPDLVFALVSSLVSAYVLIPRITGSERESTRNLLSQSISFLAITGGITCTLLAIYTPALLVWLYPGLAVSTDFPSFVGLARLLLIQPILLGISGVLGSVTQVHRRFVLFALSPVLYNVGIIAGTLWLYPRFGLTGLGLGVLMGTVGYLLASVPVVFEAGVMPRLMWPRLRDIMPIVRDSVPRSLALGVGSIVMLALVALASRVGEGAVSVFTLATNLESVPLGLIGASYAVAAFPSLSAAATPERRAEFISILTASARHVILWSCVALGLIAVLRAHIVRALLGAGAFDWNDTRLTAAVLAILAVGLAAQGLILLFSRALYALRYAWLPFLYQLIAGGLTISGAYVLLHMPPDVFAHGFAAWLKVGQIPGISVLLVALASTVGQLVLLGFLLGSLARSTTGLVGSLTRPLFDGVFAALIGGGAAYLVLMVEGGIAPLTSLASVVIQGTIAGAVGLLGAALALWYVENEEFTIVLVSLKRLLRFESDRQEALTPSAGEVLEP